MSTRGTYGFRKNGIDKLTYNHSDSYPDWLGDSIARFCAETSVEDMNAIYDAIELVKEESTPTPEQVERCVEAGYFDDAVGKRSELDWYCLLRGLMGDLDEYAEIAKAGGTIYMIDDGNFILDSLFCEYGYVIDLDDEVLEFWKGFQKKPDPDNRYGMEPDERGYYPCRLVLKFPLSEISTANVQEIVRKMNRGLTDAEREAVDFLVEKFDIDESEALEAYEKLDATNAGFPEFPDDLQMRDGYEDLAESYVLEYFNVPDGLMEYVDLERYGRDMVSYGDGGTWVKLNSGKLVGWLS